MPAKDRLTEMEEARLGQMKEQRNWVITAASTFLMVCLLLAGGCPIYKVWQQEKTGEAALARATQDRQIRVEEAKAVKESAIDLAEAERIRAEGVRDANEIIAAGLGGPEGYLRYLWIQSVAADESCEVRYIATEAGLPILEAKNKEK